MIGAILAMVGVLAFAAGSPIFGTTSFLVGMLYAALMADLELGELGEILVFFGAIAGCIIPWL